MAIESISPTTGQKLKTYPEMPVAEFCAIIEKVHDDQLVWKKKSFHERAQCFEKAAETLEHNKEEYAKLMSNEMGKPIVQGRGEVEKCAWVCRYYAENAAKFLEDEAVNTEASKSFIAHQPVGIILAVMPWNFPFWQVFRAAAPTIMAGNGMVLKHSSNVPDCALSIEAIFQQAGFPINIFRTLLISSKAVPTVLAHDHVKAATLTGSSEAGANVAALAGTQVKKVVLELGGSDPYVILADADLEKASQICATARMINNGQSCVAAKRFIVEEKVAGAFEKLLIQQMEQYTLGDPLLDDTKLGPMARIDLRDELHKQVESSIAAGARLSLGGQIPEGNGAFYPATVLTDVTANMPAYHEELFGPVATIIKVKDKAEAIQVANDTPFGLGAAVFTRDIAEGTRIAREELEAGCCFVNDFVKSDPRLPFGGVKKSGYGRELGSYGIKEFVNTKTVVVL